MSVSLDAELKVLIVEIALSADQMVIVFEGEMKNRLIKVIGAVVGMDMYKLMNKAPYILAMSDRMRDEVPRLMIGKSAGYRWMIPMPE